MNTRHFSFAFSATLFSAIGLLQAPLAHAAQEERTVPVAQVFAPKGFDTNDVTQIIVSGNLPNFCYKSPKSVVTVNDNIINIEVKALYDTEAACAQVVNPFLDVVSVGVLAEGNYEVRVNESASATPLTATIEVTLAATLEVNDHIYARVDHAEQVENSRKVQLHGYNPSDCFDLDKFTYISNGKDTLSVLPIMKKISSHCPLKMTPFTYEAEIPVELSVNEALLHIRVMKGDSVNILFNNQAPAQARQ